MVAFIKENYQKGNKMDRVKKLAKKEMFIKDIILKEIKMEKENYLLMMVIFIIAYLKMENPLKILIIIN